MNGSRRAKVPIPPQAVEALLQLPSGMRLKGMWVDQDPLTLWVMVESVQFDEIDIAAEAPIVTLNVEVTKFRLGEVL